LKKDSLDNELQNPLCLVSIHSLFLLLSLPFSLILLLLFFAEAAAHQKRRKERKRGFNSFSLKSQKRAKNKYKVMGFMQKRSQI
jgi:choline-glycine betaine transporter